MLNWTVLDGGGLAVSFPPFFVFFCFGRCRFEPFTEIAGFVEVNRQNILKFFFSVSRNGFTLIRYDVQWKQKKSIYAHQSKCGNSNFQFDDEALGTTALSLLLPVRGSSTVSDIDDCGIIIIIHFNVIFLWRCVDERVHAFGEGVCECSICVCTFAGMTDCEWATTFGVGLAKIKRNIICWSKSKSVRLPLSLSMAAIIPCVY